MREHMEVQTAVRGTNGQARLEEPGKLDRKQELIELRAKGYSLRKAAKSLDISKSTAANWQAELEAEIATAKAIELEALYERAYMAKEQRIRLLAGQLKAIKAEIKSRGLETVPTKDLLRLQLDYYQALLDEFIEPRVLSGDEIAELKALSALSGSESLSVPKQVQKWTADR